MADLKSTIWPDGGEFVVTPPYRRAGGNSDTRHISRAAAEAYATELEAGRVFHASDLQDDWKERERREGRATSSSVCFMCGRGINVKRPFFEVYYGGPDVIRRDYDAHNDAIDGDDMGCYEIGPECAKRLPAGVAHKRAALVSA